MYSICKQTHPATGIEHAISCHFFNKSFKCLVTAGANLIRVFRLVPDLDAKRKYDQNSDRCPPKAKLECMVQYQLFGNIMSLESISLAGSSRDAILLAFKDAKLSVVEYELDTHELKTLSLHYFEEEEMKDGWTNHYHVPTIRTDPENRCAVMTVFGRKLVVLPFRRDTCIDDGDNDIKPMSNSSSDTRVPILSSYTIVLKEFIEKIDNIIDIQFLHGYYEPTLLILFEPLKTFAGRVAVRRDTCAMVAISLNLHERVHPVIWSVSNLPFDCIRAIPIKKPLGGTLIFTVNAIIYLNQSIPPYGVSLNSIAETATNFPLKSQEDLNISLDCSQTTFLAEDTLVISLKGGELYVLKLLADSMRYVRSFHFEKAAASVLTTCICVYEKNFLFLGSRLGNSLLLRYTEKYNEVITLVETSQPNADRSTHNIFDQTVYNEENRLLGTINDCMATNVSDIRDPEELEVYGLQKQASLQITSYFFEVCDSLLNIGPCGNVSVGEPAFSNEDFSNSDDFDLEFVTTAGYGKNGALCLLQKSVKPHIVTTFTLPGCFDMWTAHGGDDKHALLILSQEDGTMVLQTGNEINEIDNTGFATDIPTIFICNLGNLKYIVQVTMATVRLLQDVHLVQYVPLELGSPIVYASSADPYVSILTKEGQVVTLMLRETKGNARLVISKTTISNNPPVTSLSMYKDLSGLFTNKISEQHVDSERCGRSFDCKMESENEDDLLYGDGSDFKMPSLKIFPSKSNRSPDWWNNVVLDGRATYWLFIVRENSNLEIYSIPDFKLCYYVSNLCFGNRVLVDNLESVVRNVFPSLSEETERTIQKHYEVKEILMVALGKHASRPLLLVRLDNDLYIYEVYQFPRGNLKIRFHKMKHPIIYSGKFEPAVSVDGVLLSVQERAAKLRYFSNISGYSGVFICGSSPYWVFMTSRGELRTHSMTLDGEILSFAAFNNVNCPQGFLYFNNHAELRIGLLPTHLSYDAPWPVRKVPLRCTPQFVTYHLESKTYCLIMSASEPSKEYYKFNGEDKELSIEDKGERFPYPSQEKFTLLLFSPVSWDIIPNSQINLDEWEHVNCLKNVSLAYEGTRSGFKGYIAVGTNFNYGEDITSRGRILIFDVIEVVPEPGQPLTKNRFKEIYAKDQKGPVTALSQVKGFLVSAIGQKIYIWQLKDNDLVGVAFIDTQIYTHQILTIKSLLLVTDIFKSISLLRFQEEYKTLSLVSRDFRPCEIFAAEYVVDNTNLGFLVSDSEKNLIIYMYQPEARESVGGQRLLRRADFHMGQAVNAFFRIRCKLGELRDDKKYFLGADNRQITMFATLDGGLGYLMPVPEKTYRRFLMLQNVLLSQGAHTAGLNPREFRTYKSWKNPHIIPARSIVDGDLLYSYLDLPVPEKLEVAKKLGIKHEELLDDLLDIQKLTNHF